jgi:O-antigen/teichoic acid export membrane protein
VLAQLIYALGVIVVINGPGDVAFVPVAQFAGELGAALLLCGFLLRGMWPTFALADGWRILRRTGYLGLARIFRTIVITFDVVMLGFLATDRDVGLYSAAYRFTFLLMAIASSIAAAYLPSYARIASGATASLRRLVETSLAIAVTIGAPLVAGSIVTARPLLALLFGPDYVGATTAFRLLMLSVGVVFLHWCLSNLLIVAHRTRLQATIHGVAAAVNIGLNFVLIPRFGIAGAAAATLVAEITIAIAGIVVLTQMDVLPRFRPFLGPLVATLAMSLAVWWAGNYVPLVGRFVLGGVVYVAVLGAIPGIRFGSPESTAGGSTRRR